MSRGAPIHPRQRRAAAVARGPARPSPRPLPCSARGPSRARSTEGRNAPEDPGLAGLLSLARLPILRAPLRGTRSRSREPPPPALFLSDAAASRVRGPPGPAARSAPHLGRGRVAGRVEVKVTLRCPAGREGARGAAGIGAPRAPLAARASPTPLSPPARARPAPRSAPLAAQSAGRRRRPLPPLRRHRGARPPGPSPRPGARPARPPGKMRLLPEWLLLLLWPVAPEEGKGSWGR